MAYAMNGQLSEAESHCHKAIEIDLHRRALELAPSFPEPGYAGRVFRWLLTCLDFFGRDAAIRAEWTSRPDRVASLSRKDLEQLEPLTSRLGLPLPPAAPSR